MVLGLTFLRFNIDGSFLFCLFCFVVQALTVNALSGEDRERWMRGIADKVQQLKDALVVLPKRKGTR